MPRSTAQCNTSVFQTTVPLTARGSSPRRRAMASTPMGSTGFPASPNRSPTAASTSTPNLRRPRASERSNAGTVMVESATSTPASPCSEPLPSQSNTAWAASPSPTRTTGCAAAATACRPRAGPVRDLLKQDTLANLPAWGATTPTIGNNPLIIAVPRLGGNVLLDMATSQFSYGMLAAYSKRGQPLPVDGGFDSAGNLTKDAAAIEASQRALPIGYWKGSGLSLVLDMLAAMLSGGHATYRSLSTHSARPVSLKYSSLSTRATSPTLKTWHRSPKGSSIPCVKRRLSIPANLCASPANRPYIFARRTSVLACLSIRRYGRSSTRLSPRTAVECSFAGTLNTTGSRIDPLPVVGSN